MYLFMLVLFFFAAFGLLLVYFFFLSAIGETFSFESIPTDILLAIVSLTFIFFANGLNAGLVCSYRAALWKERVTITKFFNYVIDRAPECFAIQLIRDIIWLVLIGPVIALYIYALNGVQYMDWIVGLVVLMITFVVHMLFTPATLCAGMYDNGIFGSLKQGLGMLRRKHVMFIGLYVLFALVWLLNFVPILQLVTIFFLYPILYTALIVMVENSTRPGGPRTEEDD